MYILFIGVATPDFHRSEKIGSIRSVNWKLVLDSVALFIFFLQIFFDDMDIFNDYCVVYERLKTVPQIRIVPLDKVEDQYVVQVSA